MQNFLLNLWSFAEKFLYVLVEKEQGWKTVLVGQPTFCA